MARVAIPAGFRVAAGATGGSSDPGDQRPRVRLTRSLADRRHTVGARFVLTTLDQGIASLSNFGVGVAVARIGGIAALGAYSLAYIVWLVLADVHRSVVTDPMAIENDLRGGGDVARSIRLGLAAELGLGAALGAALALVGLVLWLTGQQLYGTAFLALAPWLPFLLAQDYWRWVAFMRATPGHALANDLVFDAVQAAAFAALFFVGLHSSVLAIAAWGSGAVAGAGFGLWQHSIRPAWRGGFDLIRRRWRMSRWILAGAVTTWGGSNLYVVLTGVFLGPAGIGGLRAAISLVSGPSLVLVQAGGSVGLPEASKALQERGWPGLRRVQRVVTVAGMASVGAIGLVVLLFGHRLLVALYGPGFGHFAAAADLQAFGVLAGTVSLGAVLSLKTTRRTGNLFWSSGLSLVVSVVAVVVLVPLFGVEGAAGSSVAKNLTSSSTYLALHRKYSRRAAEERYAREWSGDDAGTEPPTPELAGTGDEPAAATARGSDR
ncbi:MAG: hypothetical protein ACRDYZ_12395 [Acidimicrobiales bacterium]